MIEIKCFLCCKKASIRKDGKKRDLLRKELTVFFLVNKLLKVSTSLCAGFLETEGNPSSWFDVCGPCSDLIQDAEIVSKKIRKLQNKRKSLVQEIENFILKAHRKEDVQGDKEETSLDVSRSIRSEVALRKRLENLEEVSQKQRDEEKGIVKIKPEPLDAAQDEGDLDSAEFPPSPPSPEQTNESESDESDDESSGSEFSGGDRDKEHAGLHECKKCGKQYKYSKPYRVHIKECKSAREEDISENKVRRRSSNSNSDDDAELYECKICGKQYKYVKAFRCHVKTCKSTEAEPAEVIPRNTRKSRSNSAADHDDHNSEENLEDVNLQIKIETENSPVRSPSPNALDNYDSENEWQPPECDDTFEEEPSTSENTLKTGNNENRRKSDRPRKQPDHYFLKQQEEQENRAKEEETVDGEMKRGRGRPNKAKKTKKLKAKPENRFTCKCGEAFKSSSDALSHRKNCESYTYMSVGTRNPSSSTQENKSNSLKAENISKLSSKTRNVIIDSKGKKRLYFKIRRICMCDKKFGCKHKSTLRQYRSNCRSRGVDPEEVNRLLVTESEDVQAKEVGFYACRHMCRFGFLDRYVYGNHLIGNHKEHLERPRKCKCCKRCFITEKDLNVHIENTEACKTFVEAKANKSISSSKSKIENKKETKPAVVEYDEPPSTSSCSSDDYELIDDDEQIFGADNETSIQPVAGNEETEANISTNVETTQEGQKAEEIINSPETPVDENIGDSTTAEGSKKPEKMRLFRTFRCLTCKDGFKTPVLLNSHIRGIHKAQERPFVCHLCPEIAFRMSSNLDVHYTEIHEGVQANSCPIIEGGTEEHKYRVLRVREKKIKKPIGLLHVAKKNVDLSDLSDPDWDPENMLTCPPRKEPKTRRHIRSDEYDPKYSYECQICEIKYDTENSYVRHALFTHFEEIGVCETDLVFHCDLCEKKYTTGGLLRAHKRTVHEGKKYPLECTVCGEEFKLYKSYLEHIEDSHVRDGPVLCDICNVRFCDEQSKTIHVRRSHQDDTKPHRCSVCNVGYATDMELRYHRLKHFRNEEYMCEFCSTVFKGQHLLKRHQMIKHFDDMGVDPLKCVDCGKIFGDDTNLQKHIKNVHVKDHNFICSECGRGFAKEESLEKHVQERHVEGKKFLCSECPRQFWKKSGLRHHEKKVHGEVQIYECQICTKKIRRFKTEKLLKNHMEKHLILYKCHICSKLFSAKKYIHVHLKGVHSVTASHKNIKGFKADQDTVMEVIARSSQIGFHQNSSSNEKRRKSGKIKIHPKKRKESHENVSGSSSPCNNPESTTSSADYNSSGPIPLIVPQPQMSTPSSLTPSMLMTPRHQMEQPSYPMSMSSNPLLGYTNNQHFMVPQGFHPSMQQNQHPSTSNYIIHRNIQGPSHSFPHYPDPFSQN